MDTYLQFFLERRVREVDELVCEAVEQKADTAIPTSDSTGTENDNLHPEIDSKFAPTSSVSPPTDQNFFPKVTNIARENLLMDEQITVRSIFRPLENHILACLSNFDCLNSSFLTPEPPQFARAASEGAALVEKRTVKRKEGCINAESSFPDMDAKTLLLGDFAENGTWWAGKTYTEPHQIQRTVPKALDAGSMTRVNSKTPRINWLALDEWYCAIISVGRCWRVRLSELQDGKSHYRNRKVSILSTLRPEYIQKIEDEIAKTRMHLQRTLLQATETLLRRPGRPLETPEHSRFLLILLANPLLYSSDSGRTAYLNPVKYERSISHGHGLAPEPSATAVNRPLPAHPRSQSTEHGISRRNSGVVKRILGLMSHLPSECHHYLVNWFSRFTEGHFRRIVDLIGSFLTHRLSKQLGKRGVGTHDVTTGFIPSVPFFVTRGRAQLHAPLGPNSTEKSGKIKNRAIYKKDWQIRAAARVMSLFFSANSPNPSQMQDTVGAYISKVKRRAVSVAGNRTYRDSPLVPISAFYNTLLDYSDLVADFEAWESRREEFFFCQYPMFLSIWAKIHIMEHDARRQMEIKAREAFFNSIMSRKAISQYLVLKVRRDCLVEDSLRGVSEVVGTGQEEIKKGLRIEFLGEEGLDSGGLRKEWFLLLVREVFDPDYGLFVYDEDTRYCYFNPSTFETSDQFFLVGVVLGLAIYNSTILDVALPPFAFRKLLASAPNYTGPATSSTRPAAGYTLKDLAEFRPSLAEGFKHLLDFDGDVQETYCWDFVAIVERYGQSVQVPLCPNGERRAVTNSNRHEFVDLYIRYLLDDSVARQYEPFKRGFFTVCAGNALSLFRPEEIELLVRGSDEPLDVATLRTVAIYDGWGKDTDIATEPAVIWFWEAFERAKIEDQKKLLSFITSSDRIPAMGATSLVIKITCLGSHSNRFPIARTCFNMLGLYRYESAEILECKLWRAVIESEGFGIK